MNKIKYLYRGEVTFYSPVQVFRGRSLYTTIGYGGVKINLGTGGWVSVDPGVVGYMKIGTVLTRPYGADLSAHL